MPPGTTLPDTSFKPWDEVASEAKVDSLPVEGRIEVFRKWKDEVQSKLLGSGAFDTPGAYDKFTKNALGVAARITDPLMMSPSESDVENRYRRWGEVVYGSPDPTPEDEKALSEVTSGKKKAARVGNRIVVDPSLIRKPDEYRKAIMEADAPFDLKAIAASQRGEREQEHALSRRQEMTGLISPYAPKIMDDLQKSQEIFGIDVRDVSGDLKLQKDEDGEWTIPSTEKVSSISDRISSLLPAGSPGRLPLEQLSKYQEKWNLTDDEVQQDYLESIKATAPGSVQRIAGEKTDMGTIDSRLEGDARVVNKDIGADRIVIPNVGLHFDKEGFEAAVDSADTTPEVKAETKASREALAGFYAPQMFNLLQNNRDDFRENYAPIANDAKVSGKDAPAKMAEAVTKYFKDKKNQGALEDIGEFFGQAGSGALQGVGRMINTINSIGGMMGNQQMADDAATFERGFQQYAQADEMVAGQIGMPKVTKYARELAGVMPDVAAQVGLGILTGGAFNAAGAAVGAARKGQLAAMIGYAGLQTAGSLFSDMYGRMVEQGMDKGEAMSKARSAAAVGGAITAAVTGWFSAKGMGGIEKPLDPGKYTVRDLFKSGLAKKFFSDPEARKMVWTAGKAIAKDANDEYIEEWLDQFLQGLAAYRTDPTEEQANKTLDDLFRESFHAAALGQGASLAVSAAKNMRSTTNLDAEGIKYREGLKDLMRKAGEEEQKGAAAGVQEESLEDIVGKFAATKEAVTTAKRIENDAPAVAAALAQIATDEDLPGKTAPPSEAAPVPAPEPVREPAEGTEDLPPAPAVEEPISPGTATAEPPEVAQGLPPEAAVEPGETIVEPPQPTLTDEKSKTTPLETKGLEERPETRSEPGEVEAERGAEGAGVEPTTEVGQQVADAFSGMTKAATEGARRRVAELLDRGPYILRNKAAGDAALNNPDYRATRNADGTVEVTDVVNPDTGAWHKNPEAGKSEARVKIADLKDSRGRIGKQGFTSDQAIALINRAAGTSYDVDGSLRDALEQLRKDPVAVSRTKEFLENNPVDVSALPDGSLHLQDGHHRAFLADQLGMESLPTQQKTSATKTESSTQSAPITVASVDGEGDSAVDDSAEKKAELIQFLEDVIATKKANGQKVPQATIDKLASLRSGEANEGAVFLDESIPGHPFNSESPVLPIKILPTEAGMRSIESVAKNIEKLRGEAAGKAHSAKGASKAEYNQQVTDLDLALKELGRVEREVQARMKSTTKSDQASSSPVVQRDPSKPEQMTPDEWVEANPSLLPRSEKLKISADWSRKFESQLKVAADDVASLRADETGVGRLMDNAIMAGGEAQAIAMREWLLRDKALKPAAREALLKYTSGGQPGHSVEVQQAAFSNLPVSAAAADAYGITLPEGYVKQGDLYVYQPDKKFESKKPESNEKPSQATKTKEKAPAVKESPATSPETPSALKPQTKAPFKPSVERFAAFFTDEGMTQAAANKNAAALMEAIETRTWTDLLHPDNKTSRAIWNTWTRQKLPNGLQASKDAFQKFVDDYATSPETTGESIEVGDEVEWITGGGRAIATVERIRDGKASVEYFGMKFVPVSELTLRKKSRQRESRERREAENAAKTPPPEPAAAKMEDAFSKSEIDALNSGLTPPEWKAKDDGKTNMTLVDANGKEWAMTLQRGGSPSITLSNSGDSFVFKQDKTTGGSVVDQTTEPPQTSDAPAEPVLSSPVGLKEVKSKEKKVKPEKKPQKQEVTEKKEEPKAEKKPAAERERGEEVVWSMDEETGEEVRESRATDEGGSAPDQVTARLKQKWGVKPGGMVTVVNKPGAKWKARAYFRDGQLTRIQLNAAYLPNDAAVDTEFYHEMSHGATESGVLDELLSTLSDSQRKAIKRTVDRLKYKESVRNREEAARGVEALAKSFAVRAWWEKAVAAVMKWARDKFGIPLTRLAAEKIAASQVARVHEKVKAASVSRSGGEARESRRRGENESLSEWMARLERQDAPKGGAVTVSARRDGENSLGVSFTIIAPGHPKHLSSTVAPPGTDQAGLDALARQSVEDYDAGRNSGQVFNDDERESRSSFVTPEMDAEYLELAKDPEKNREQLQEMVDAAAKKAGYETGPAWHSTIKSFNAFDRRYTTGNLGFHFGLTQSQAVGDNSRFSRTQKESPGSVRVIKAWLNVKNPLTLRDRGSWVRDVVIREINEKTGLELDENNVNEKFVVSELQRLGYDGIAYENVGEGDPDEDNPAIIAFEPSQIKLAEPVVRNDQGEIIPLSQRFNPESDDIRESKRSQTLGVENLGREYQKESFTAVQEAVKESVFNGSTADVNDRYTYHRAQSLIASIMGDKASLKRVQDRLLGTKAMQDADIVGEQQLQSLPAALWAELIDYGMRMVQHGGPDGISDWSLLKKLIIASQDINQGLDKAASDDKSSGSTKEAQRLAARAMMARKFGGFIAWFKDNEVATTAAMKEQGFSQDRIDALAQYVIGEIKAAEMRGFVDSKEDLLKGAHEKIGGWQEEGRAATEKAGKSKKPKKEGEPAEDEEEEEPDRVPPKLTPEQLRNLPVKAQNAYKEKLNAFQAKTKKTAAEIEKALQAARDRFIKDGTENLADAVFPEPPPPETLEQMLRGLDREMLKIIKKVVGTSKEAPSKDKLWREIATKLALPEFNAEKKALVDKLIQEKIDKAREEYGDEDADSMQDKWDQVAAQLDIPTNVSGATVSRAIHRVIANKSFPLKMPQIIRLANPDAYNNIRDMVANQVADNISGVTGDPGIDPEKLEAMREHVRNRFDHTVAEAAKRSVMSQTKRIETGALDEDAKKAAEKLMEGANKSATVNDIIEALMTGPWEKVKDPAWRRQVIRHWLEKQRIPEAAVRAEELDRIVAALFAEAQKTMLQRYVDKANKKAEEEKNKKDGVKPIKQSQMDRIGKVIREGWLTGAPLNWKEAFVAKEHMKPMTTADMREVVRLESIRRNEANTRTEQQLADSKLLDLYRRHGLPDIKLKVLADLYTQSALTGLATQSLQVLAGLTNLNMRLAEELISSGLTGRGIVHILRAAKHAYRAWWNAYRTAWKNDAYRNQQQEEIQQMTSLRKNLMMARDEFKNAKGAGKAVPAVKVFAFAQDFFRRFMSSMDDAAVTAVKTLTEQIGYHKLLRESGMTKQQANDLIRVASQDAEELTLHAMTNLGMDKNAAAMYAKDKVDQRIQQAMIESTELRHGPEAAEKMKAEIGEVQQFADAEADVEVGIGPARDKGSRYNLGQKAAEYIISGMEKNLQVDKADRRNPDAQGKYLLWRQLLGFLRTPWNIFSRSFARGPMGLYRAAVASMSPAARAGFQRTMATDRQLRQRWKEGIIHSFGLLALYALAKSLNGDDDDPDDDVITVNGDGPEDKQAQAAWRAAGHVKNTIEIKIGDTRFAIPFGRSGLESLRPALLMMGAARDMELNGMITGAPMTFMEYSKNYGLDLVRASNQFGIKNLAQWRDDVATANNVAGKIAYMMSPFIPYSGLLKSAGRGAAPDSIDRTSMSGSILASTPFFWLGEKGYNIYGLPVYGTPSSTVGVVTKALFWAGLPFSVDTGGDKEALEVLKYTARTGLAPSAKTRGQLDKEMKKDNPDHQGVTNAQWSEYLKTSGEARLNGMKGFVKSAEGISDRARERRFNSIADRADAAGRAAMK